MALKFSKSEKSNLDIFQVFEHFLKNSYVTFFSNLAGVLDGLDFGPFHSM
jgi:hypothetical protein